MNFEILQKILTGSRSRSEDITPVPSKSKKDTKDSNATNLPLSTVTKTVPQTVEAPTPAPVPAPILTSEAIKKDIVPSEVNVVTSSTSVTNNVQLANSEAVEKEPDLDTANVLPEFLTVLLKKIAEQEGFTDYTLDVSAGSNHGDGFLAVIKRVIVSGTRNGKTDKLPLICKLMPTSKARREQFNSDAVFIREAFMYSQVLPTFAAFQKEKGLSLKDSFCEYPKCYGTLDDKENDRFVIVLEDLKATGYELFDKFKPADFNHVKLFVESLGKFHAVSFALKDQRPEVFAKYTHLKDVFLQQIEDQPEVMGPMFAYMFDKAIGAFKPEEEAEIKALTKLKGSFVEELKRVGWGEASEPFSIINHGDCWNNNMMYRYGTEVRKYFCLKFIQ